MADRIIKMRALLKQNLENLGSQRDWSHITSQVELPLVRMHEIKSLTRSRSACLLTRG